MKKSELKEMIREEIQKLIEKEKSFWITNLNKGIMGRYRLGSDDFNIVKAFNLSGLKYGAVFADEIGFDRMSDRDNAIKILNK